MGHAEQQMLQAAIALHSAGKLAEAEAQYRALLGREPNNVDALHLLGVLASQCGKQEQAIALINRAIAGRPQEAAFYANLGEAFRALGRLDPAIAQYRRAIELQPGLTPPYMNYARALRAQNKVAEAVNVLLTGLSRGLPLQDELIAVAATFDAQYRFDEALAIYREGLARRPGDERLTVAMGNTLHAAGRFSESLECYDEVLLRLPDIAEAHWNKALVLLTLGNYQQGWKEYEWRWRCPGFPYKRQNFPQPIWDGQDLSGRTLLLDAEGGFGDIMQFVRYAKIFAGRGARVIVGSPPELKALLQRVEGVSEVISKGDRLPAFDFQLQLLGCPMRLETTLATIPIGIPYLSAPPEKVEGVRSSIREESGAMQVGFVWCGRSMPYPNRSSPLKAWAPLFDVPGVRFHSLQRDEGIAELKAAPPDWRLVDHSQELRDFTDTAAIVATLDLVISIDSGVAHLAGAMGKPTWVMLPFSADWRWMSDREDCPWYPTVRLFRQSQAGQWDDVAAKAADALRRRLQEP
jgi:Flp pilus assembly protein TadD